MKSIQTIQNIAKTATIVASSPKLGSVVDKSNIDSYYDKTLYHSKSQQEFLTSKLKEENYYNPQEASKVD